MPVGLDPTGEGLGVVLIGSCRLEATRAGAAVGLDAVRLDVVQILLDRRGPNMRLSHEADFHAHPRQARSGG